MFHVKQPQILVIGGGHAGCEAALAASRMGVSTILVTLKANKIAEMSCNPSIGGVGKGQLVKEIDALGGEMGRNADFTGIQFKRLNTRKGSAVQSSRCQSDKKLYALRMQDVIRNQPHLEVVEAEVKEFLVENGQMKGVILQNPAGNRQEVLVENVVITAGTFMQGLMHCGDEKKAGGRFGEGSSQGLSEDLRRLGFNVLRLKTGTPPRLLAESIDFSQMERQGGDGEPRKFSFFPTQIDLPQVPCYLTYTNPETHAVISENLKRSPLYSGKIQGVGPRYCPSIEDKVVKFPEKPRHQLFFEPEALDSNWIYPNGISTSLPADVQEAFVRTLPGCANVVFARHGYAVEYDCIDPRQLLPTFESRLVGGLFLGGQVNGTSGYEEAAAQGLIAGINAALRAKKEPPLILSRSESYIGVMIDDLISMGVAEPYRMFTSRAEFRLSLREDNADLRLSHHGARIGLLSSENWAFVQKRQETLIAWREWMKSLVVKPTEETNARFIEAGTAPLAYASSVYQILKRPELSLSQILTAANLTGPTPIDPDTAETLEIEIKYEGYIQIQKQEMERLSKMQALDIPEAFDFTSVAGLSIELRQKLDKARPKNLSEASRISGVTPAAMTSLLFHLKQKGNRSANRTL